MKKWPVDRIGMLILGLLAGLLLGRFSSRQTDRPMLSGGNENAPPPSTPDILSKPGDAPPGPKTDGQHPSPATGDGTVDRYSLLCQAAKDFPDVVKRLSLRLFDENFDPVMSDWELLGVEPALVSEIAGKLKAPLDMLHDMEASNYKIISNDGGNVSLFLPPLSETDSEKIKQEIETAFSSSLSKELAAVLASSYTWSNYAVTGALTGRTRILSVEPRHNKNNPQLIDSFLFTTRVVLLGNESHVTNGEKTPVEILNKITDYTISLRSKKIPRQWEHILSQSE